MSEILIQGKGWAAEIVTSKDVLMLDRVEITLYPTKRKIPLAISQIVSSEILANALKADDVDFHIDKKISNPSNTKDNAIKIFICPSRKMEYNPAGPFIRDITKFIISLRDEEIKSSSKKKK